MCYRFIKLNAAFRPQCALTHPKYIYNSNRDKKASSPLPLTLSWQFNSKLGQIDLVYGLQSSLRGWEVWCSQI